MNAAGYNGTTTHPKDWSTGPTIMSGGGKALLAINSVASEAHRFIITSSA